MAFALEELTKRIIACGIAVHRGLGGGLLESCYDAAMCIELNEQGLHFRDQVLTYLKGTGLTVGLLMNFHAVTLKAGLRRFDLKDGVTTEALGKSEEV